jgi:ABC-2 type transport system permease protein/sodium transport system permease protein
MVAALVTALVFGGLPWLIAVFNRVRMRSGIGLRGTQVAAFVAAGLLGLALWPAAHEAFLVNEWLGITTLRPEQFAAVKNLLDEWRGVSPVWILFSLAVMPGVFEELFFRGFFFTSLRTLFSPWKTIILSAVLFGLFHVVAANVLAPERFLPSTLLGLVLGCCCRWPTGVTRWRTRDSVWRRTLIFHCSGWWRRRARLLPRWRC